MVVRQASFTKHLLSWLKRLLLIMTAAELNKAAVHYTPLLLLIQTFKIFYLQIWSFFCNQNYSLLHIFYIPNTHKSACLNWLFLHLISGKYFIMVTILAVPLNMKVSTRDENIKKISSITSRLWISLFCRQALIWYNLWKSTCTAAHVVEL